MVLSPIGVKNLESTMLITGPKQLGIYLRDIRRNQKRNQTKVGDIGVFQGSCHHSLSY